MYRPSMFLLMIYKKTTSADSKSFFVNMGSRYDGVTTSIATVVTIRTTLLKGTFWVVRQRWRLPQVNAKELIVNYSSTSPPSFW
jgi:hypothetical protein